MPYGQSCYSFHSNAKTFHQAQEICKKKGKVLVEIETQEENDMISELLFQSSLTSTKMDQVIILVKMVDFSQYVVILQVWTGGVGSNIARKNVWFWHSDTDKVMEYRNFWKGWTGGDKLARDNLEHSQVINCTVV